MKLEKGRRTMALAILIGFPGAMLLVLMELKNHWQPFSASQLILISLFYSIGLTSTYYAYRYRQIETSNHAKSFSLTNTKINFIALVTFFSGFISLRLPFAQSSFADGINSKSSGFGVLTIDAIFRMVLLNDGNIYQRLISFLGILLPFLTVGSYVWLLLNINNATRWINYAAIVAAITAILLPGATTGAFLFAATMLVHFLISIFLKKTLRI